MTSQQVATQAQQMAVAQASGAAVSLAQDAITQTQMFIINSFRGQIYISDQLDVQDTPLYDTVTLNASQSITSSTAVWFANILNSGKTLAQTNMAENKQLPAPEAFAVFGIKLGWSEGILRSDLQTLIDSWAYVLKIGKKDYQQANPRQFSAGWGISGYTTRTAESFYTNGLPSWGSMHTLAIKLVLANQQSFYSFLAENAAGSQVLSASGTGLILINEFVGLYARGVQ